MSGTSVRGGGSGRTATTTLTSSSSASNAAGGIIRQQRGANNSKKPAGNRPRPPQSHQQKARQHPPSTQRQSASGRGRPRPNQNGVSSRSNGTSTSKSSSVGTSRSKNGAQSSTTTAQTRSQPPRKAPPTHLLTNARTSVPVSEEAKRQQQNQKRRNANRPQLQSVNENESSTDGNINVRNDDGFEALMWNPFQGDDGIPNNEFWSGGSTQAGLTSSSVVNSVENNQSRQVSMSTISSSNTSDASSVVSSAYSVEGGVHIPGGGSNKTKLIGGSIRSTGKTTRKLAGKLGSKLTSVGAKARGLTQMGDDAFYGAGEAGFSTNIRTITEEEASGAAAAVSSSITSSTASNGNTTIVSVTQRTRQRRPSPQSLEGSGQTAVNRGVIPTAFARLASVQNISTPGGTAVATAQAVPVPATIIGATSVVATTTTLRPPAPVVVGGKVVVKGMAINRTFAGDLKTIEMAVQKYKRIRASAAGSRQGPRAASQSNSQLAESIAELRSCLPKLEALVNRTMLSRTNDANALERLLSLNDELRLILANLKGEGIKRRIHIRDGPISRSSQLPTAQQARDQHLFKKMREDSNEITAPIVAAKANSIQGHRSANGAGSAPANQEPLFHDDPFHGFPEFSNFDDDFETIPEDESVNEAKSSKPSGSRPDQRKPMVDDDESSATESDTSSISMLPVVTDDNSLCSDSQDGINDARRKNVADDDQDRDGLSRLEDEVARLEKQLSGLDPLAKLAMDSILDEEMSHMSNLSITSDGDASADAGFADMEREMMKQLAMGNAWMASEAVDDTPKVTRVKFSQEVTVFEIPNRHQARLAER